MDELTNVFADFKRQVDEIAGHAQQVYRVDFSAKLKNGTSFNFTYNSDTFNRSRKDRQRYRPASVFNAVVDIIGGSTAIFLLVFLLVGLSGRIPGVSVSPLWSVLAFSFFIAYFIISSLYHLFDMDSPARQVFSNLSEALKVISLSAANICTVLLADPGRLPMAVLATLVIAATSLLFLSMGTRGSSKASLAFTTLLPYVSLMGTFSLASVGSATLFALWSLVNLLLDHRQKARTNTVFAIMGMVALALHWLSLV
jgi:hypothetical protein